LFGQRGRWVLGHGRDWPGTRSGLRRSCGRKQIGLGAQPSLSLFGFACSPWLSCNNSLIL
jgi:hypothetical protein